MAHFPKAHLIFAVPVVSLVAGGVLMLILIFGDGNYFTLNPPLSTLNPP